MTKETAGAKADPAQKNLLRAALKTALVLLALIAVAAGLGFLANDNSVIDQLKFNLNLGALIGLVVVINIFCFIGFVALYAAYQWVRRDLKAPRGDDREDDKEED